jgi:diguanylate cyclase (GGDEF)-like protein/PAS domain S-box-containing protein
MSTRSRSTDSTRTANPPRRGHGSASEVALLVENITDYAIFMLDPDGYIASWNPGAAKLNGYLALEIIGKHFSVFYPHDLIIEKKPERELQTAVADGRFEAEGWRVRKDGTLYRANVVLTAMHDDAGGLIGFSKVTRDVTERFKAVELLREAEEKYRRIFEDSVTGIFRTAPDGTLLTANPAVATLFGYDSPAELIAYRPNVTADGYVNPADRQVFTSALDDTGEIKNFEYQAYRKDGSAIWLMENARLVRDSGGNVLFYEGTLIDVTERRAAEQKIHHLAFYDDLTGLPNRTLCLDRLSKALAFAHRQQKRVALLHVDIDRFQYVNDSFGHVMADLLLQGVAKRFAGIAREQDTVARVAADEFIVLLLGIGDASEATAAAARFLDATSREFKIADQSLFVTSSIGLSIFPEHGMDAESLIKSADWALHAAKDRGRNNVCCFSEDLGAKASEELALGNALQLAIENSELFLVYQPQMNVASRKIVGLEALLRWRRPELGLIPPDKFIPIAESRGMIGAIGEWVLRAACSQMRQWQTKGFPIVPVAVNVSAVQFRQWDFADLVARVLDETRLPSRYLELELTESALLSIGDATFSVLKYLHALGVTLSIDDFGTGYSSFSYLKRIPVNKLKIDRSFIDNIATDPGDAAITTAIIGMAKQLNLRVIAEGVESETQFTFLRDHDCDEIQGYYFSKPLNADLIPDKLRKLSLGSGQFLTSHSRLKGTPS